jgi:hypothetical protein
MLLCASYVKSMWGWCICCWRVDFSLVLCLAILVLLKMEATRFETCSVGTVGGETNALGM